MLRKIRITLAAISFALMSLLFLDFTGVAHKWFGWMAEIQFIPAVLALNLAVIIALIVITMLFGRVYCSVICPLGIMQDIVAFFGKKGKKKKLQYSSSKEKKWLRLTMLGIFVVTLLAGLVPVAALLDPYASFGRIVSNLFQPIYRWGNNLFALIAEHAESYTFYEVDVWLKSIPTLIVAIVSFVAIFILAWRNGRTYCNTICPVGTILGYLSKFSLYRPVIDTDKCVSCGLCARKCKAACIDSKNHTIDLSRCVVCMDCIGNCSSHAISYTRRRSNAKAVADSDASRRTFIATTLAVGTAAAMKAEGKAVDGGLAVIEDKIASERKTRITPPGSVSHRHFFQHCTACQLCISACPNGVLRPSSNLETLMQPEVSYERGYCRPECTRCSEVCPNDAILPITREQKTATQIGHAVWIKKNCVVLTDGVQCGNCARHCPTGTIKMIATDPNKEDSPRIPMIDTERCIGCGACENLCPARPFSAIYVEGHENHRNNI